MQRRRPALGVHASASTAQGARRQTSDPPCRRSATHPRTAASTRDRLRPELVAARPDAGIEIAGSRGCAQYALARASFAGCLRSRAWRPYDRARRRRFFTCRVCVVAMLRALRTAVAIRSDLLRPRAGAQPLSAVPVLPPAYSTTRVAAARVSPSVRRSRSSRARSDPSATRSGSDARSLQPTARPRLRGPRWRLGRARNSRLRRGSELLANLPMSFGNDGSLMRD